MINNSSVSGSAWNDANHNGVQDAGEAKVAGVVVELEDPSGTVLMTTTTAADGSYHFTNLAAGSYQVQFVAPTGSTFTGQHWTADGSFTSPVDSDAYGSNGITQVITLADGQATNTIDAGLIFSGPATGTASIGDRVWNDANHNGVQDAGEAGVGGVTVKLEDVNGTVLATTTSAADGSYHFNSLAAGNYQLQFVAPTGASFTGQHWTADGSFASAVDSDAYGSNGITQVITLAAGQANNTIDAGLVFSGPAPGTASIGDFVWNDANHNGVQDAGEAGVGGVTVKLEDVSGIVLATTTSASDGSYHFNNLAAGNYQLQFVAPTGAAFTGQHWTADGSFASAIDSDAYGSNGVTQVITLAASETNNTIDAGLVYASPPPAATGTVSGMAWDDDYLGGSTNSNGIHDAGELGFRGLTVELEDTSGRVLQTTLTQANGSYEFDNVAAGTYQIQFVTPTGLALTAEHVANSGPAGSSADPTTGITHSFAVTAGQTASDINVGVLTTGTVTGMAWADDYLGGSTNANGIRDAGEAGFRGLTVELEDTSGHVLQTALTQANGSYGFNNVGAGTYQIQFVAPTGFALTAENVANSGPAGSDADPTTGLTHTFTVTGGHTTSDLNVGVLSIPALASELLTPSNTLLDTAFGSSATTQSASVSSSDAGTSDAASSAAKLLAEHAALLAA